MTKKIIPVIIFSFLLFAGNSVYSADQFGAKGAEQVNDPTL
ncbi:hypothetical protein ACFL7M_17495 [Thermodesulfobacteriota bacterium]